MNCEKCGAEIPEGAVFCVQCGNRITAPDMSETPNGGSGGSTAQSGSVVSDQGVKARVGQSFATGSMTSKKFDITKLIPVAVLAVVLIIALVVFFKVRKTRVNLNDYISVENSGYDGYGTVEVRFDKEEFVKDFRGKIKPNKKIKSMIKDEDKVKAIVDRNDYSVRKEKDICRLFADVFTAAGAVEDEGKMGRLSNGDVLVYKWNFDSDAMPVDDAEEFAKEAFNVKLVSSDYEFTVDGLEKVETFDPFEGVELSFSGVSPAATAEITAKPEGNGLDYSIENGYKLKSGDDVIVTASYGWNDQEGYISEYKKMPETLEKRYKVEGVDEYIMDVSQISESDLDAMKRQTEDKIRATAANNWNDEVSVGSLDYDSAYLLAAKNTDIYGSYNKIVLVYKVGANFSFENSAYNTTYNYYYYVSYNDAIRVQDGSLLVDLNNSESGGNYVSTQVKTGPEDWDSRSYSFNGYENFDSLFSDAVTRYIEDYTYAQIGQ